METATTTFKKGKESQSMETATATTTFKKGKESQRMETATATLLQLQLDRLCFEVVAVAVPYFVFTFFQF